MHLRRPILAAVACAAATCLTPAAQADVPLGDQIVVKRRAGLSASERADLRADANVGLERTLSLDQAEVVAAEPGGRADALAALRADPDVLWAEPNRLVRAQGDPLFDDGSLWGLRNRGEWGRVDADADVDEAWALTRGAGAVVAVVDTGVDAGHPDLARRLVPGHDYVNRDGDPHDGHGHGTHVAGTVAAEEDGQGVVGVAPAARIQALKVLGDDGWGSSADVAQAFWDAGEQNVRVVNASLGSSGFTKAEEDAIAAHPNTLYVVAAGNDGVDVDKQPHYPCAYPLANVLCVGASTPSDRPASFSNVGRVSVDLFAPGTYIWSTLPGGGYGAMQGTSMASPLVAGVAALVAAAQPTYGAAQIRAALLAGVDPVSDFAALSATGGRVNAARAVGASVNQDAQPPAPEQPQPPAAAPEPPATPATPAQQPTPVTPARVTSLRVSGSGGRTAVALSVTRAAPVTIKVERKVDRTYRPMVSRSVRLAGGRHTLRLADSPIRARVTRGGYRVTAVAAGGSTSRTFTIR